MLLFSIRNKMIMEKKSNRFPFSLLFNSIPFPLIYLPLHLWNTLCNTTKMTGASLMSQIIKHWRRKRHQGYLSIHSPLLLGYCLSWLRALKMVAGSQDLAVEKTQTDGTLCACMRTNTHTRARVRTQTHTTRGSIHLNVIRPSWVDHTNINLKRQSVAWVSVCVRLHQLYACVSKLLHSICRGLQQWISSFDFSIEHTTSRWRWTDVSRVIFLT